MKKVLSVFLLVFLGWSGCTKFINPDSAYPWEYFKTATAVEETLAWKSYASCWDNFRLNYPYHIQAIGVSDFEQDGSRIVVVSEPPKHFQAYKAEEIFSQFKVKAAIKTTLLLNREAQPIAQARTQHFDFAHRAIFGTDGHGVEIGRAHV